MNPFLELAMVIGGSLFMHHVKMKVLGGTSSSSSSSSSSSGRGGGKSAGGDPQVEALGRIADAVEKDEELCTAGHL